MFVCLFFLPLYLIRWQGRYKTVAGALQEAVVSVLGDKEMKFHRSFYYWAAFISHGFASVKLEDAMLDAINVQLETL